jgi:hypothetical protein
MAAITLCDGCGMKVGSVVAQPIELKAGTTVTHYDACTECARKVRIAVAEIMSFTIEAPK